MNLNNATNEQIRTYAAALGYEFNDADAQDVRDTASFIWGEETMQDAVNDYLNAFER
jgi:hypothetical protein